MAILAADFRGKILFDKWTIDIEQIKMEINIKKIKMMIINKGQSNKRKREIICNNLLLEKEN